MSEKKLCTWRPAIGVVAMGVLACGLTAHGQALTRQAERFGIDVDAINAQLPVGQRVVKIERPITKADFVVPAQFAARAEQWDRRPR